jgi:hypothetical protein
MMGASPLFRGAGDRRCLPVGNDHLDGVVDPLARIALSLSETKSGWYVRPNRAMLLSHARSLQLVWSVLVLLFRSLEAEILILRHQLNIQRRHLTMRVAFSAMDRLIFVGLYRLVPNIIKALTIVNPDTVIRWHRAGSDCSGAARAVRYSMSSGDSDLVDEH